MAAPSLFDGIRRAIEEFGLPPIALLVLVGVIRVVYGPQEAGLIYVGLTALILLGIYTRAKYWNVKYTFGVVVVGLGLWFGVPGVFPLLVPSPFAELGSFLALVSLIGLAMMLTNKA
ncbi:hypothetical protein NP511_18055 [Natrinema thermotolerans]|uniref:DUF8216 domain-containing protein n=1 Tax=Natrinema thermotolerans TaxID=121872 RepID=A0AAF0PDR6_9EURY|nr:hypothetical protein [Natrinema thermotolerans]QCC60260.1 hypothetical protein DVR14_17120 [Natrinema thermotolerans]QCC61171.1 hypothetical protein DVR14_21250 [Natrinema thermotolerans]WMT07280.1 hypothetical protein NP511_18055 [Natrinema thermotolerans]